MSQSVYFRAICLIVILVSLIAGASSDVSYAMPGRYADISAKDSLKYICHSFIKIKTIEGKVIYIDPYAVNEFADSADIVLITHEHSDHNDLTRIHRKADCTVIRVSTAVKSGVCQTFVIGNVTVTAVPAINRYHFKNQSVGYIVQFGSIKIYHAGDTGNINELTSLANQDITYAFLPMDGTFTMSPEQATSAAAVIQADHDIPIHTAAPPNNYYDDSIAARFTSPNKLIVHHGETIVLEETVTSVDTYNEYPKSILLRQNFPNPFNPTTVISYVLTAKSEVVLKIYDILGREVTTLVNEEQQPGEHAVIFDASKLTGGIYFYRLHSGRQCETKKLTLIK